MAEATIKIDGITVHITSDIFSVKFMNLIKTIENFQEKCTFIDEPLKKQPQGPIKMDLSSKNTKNIYYTKTPINPPVQRLTKPTPNLTFTNKSIDNFKEVSQDEIEKVKKTLYDQDEPKDAIFNLSDIDLITQVKRYLQICNGAEIESYYKSQNIKYRPFHLSGLYSERFGIKTDKQKRIIRDMLRRCIEFTETEHFKNKTTPTTITSY